MRRLRLPPPAQTTIIDPTEDGRASVPSNSDDVVFSDGRDDDIRTLVDQGIAAQASPLSVHLDKGPYPIAQLNEDPEFLVGPFRDEIRARVKLSPVSGPWAEKTRVCDLIALPRKQCRCGCPARIAVVNDHLRAMAGRRKQAHDELLARGSTVYRAFLDLEQAAFSDGHLPKKTKELIAVGISVVIDCESCMQWHVEQAARAGASEPEVLEAVEVGMEMGGGPATAHARFALEVMTEVFGPPR